MIAWKPLSVCSPFLRLSLNAPPETLEQTSSGRFTFTPPMVSMKRRNPSKSTIATWSMLMPRNFSIVRTVSLAPPVA